jgi:hypothetical protein
VLISEPTNIQGYPDKNRSAIIPHKARADTPTPISSLIDPAKLKSSVLAFIKQIIYSLKEFEKSIIEKINRLVATIS